MKNTLLSSLLVGAIAGAGAAAVTTVTLKDASSGRAAAALPTTSGNVDGRTAAEADRLGPLQRDNDALRLRIASLEASVRDLVENASLSSRAPVSEAVPEDASREVVVERAVRDFLATYTPGRQSAEAFTNRVSDAMLEIRAVEDAEREETRVAARAERLEQRLDGWRETLGLDSSQVGDMREILSEQEAARANMWDNMRNFDVDRSTIRDQMRESRDETNVRIAEVLDPLQYERYQEDQDRGRGGSGGGRASGGDGTADGAQRTGREGGRRSDG